MDDTDSSSCLYGCWVGWIKICKRLNDGVERLFEMLGLFVTAHPGKVIIGCFIFAALCGLGGLRFVALQRNEELFIPQGSLAFTYLDRAENNFPSIKNRFEDVIISPTNTSDNVLRNRDIYLTALKIHDKIIAIPKFRSLCVNNTRGECIFVSGLEPLRYLKREIETIDVYTRLNSWYRNPKEIFRNDRPANLTYQNIFGDFKASADGNIDTATSVRLSYMMKFVHTDNGSIFDEVNDWEDEFISLLKKEKDLYPGYTVNYFVGRTRDDAILESTIGDLPLFSVAFILMVLFCMLVFIKIKNPVNGHFTLGIMGICVVMLGVGCGFGLAMLFGTDFVAFTGILMFLILGIGMDDMFILVDTLDRIDPSISGEERIVLTLRHVGAEISMTTLTDLIAFAVSTSTDFPGVRLFCTYAALSVTFAFLMLLTMFVALMTYDLRRIEKGKRDLCWCCVSNVTLDNPWEQEKPISNRLMRKWAEFLMKTPVKIAVVIFAAGILAAGIYGTTKTTQDFEWKKLGPDGSYFRNYANYRDDHYPAGYEVSVIIDDPSVDYTNIDTQNKIVELNKVVLGNKYHEDFTVNWMQNFQVWAQNKNMTSSGANFTNNIGQFITENPEFIADVVFEDSAVRQKVKASRVLYFYYNSNVATDHKDGMNSIRDDLKEQTTLPVYPIALWHIFAEQYAAIIDNVIQNLAICGGTILVITLPYLIHPGASVLVFFSFVSLLFELLGLMRAWDVSLDAIAMHIIIMAIGFSVDYTCHIARAFITSHKPTVEERVISSLETMGTSVLNGGISTFLGMLITAFSNAEGFRIFFKMVFSIVLLGLIHGVIILPVMMSLFIRRDMRKEMQQYLEENEDEEMGEVGPGDLEMEKQPRKPGGDEMYTIDENGSPTNGNVVLKSTRRLSSKIDEDKRRRRMSGRRQSTQAERRASRISSMNLGFEY